MQLTFMGANATVTGSRHLVQTGDARLLVDCGLFQGYKPLRLRNWAPFPVAPNKLDAVVLTHAHLDHSGYLPRLVASGFRGRIWGTPGTADLCAILLPDSGDLLEEEAAHANRRGSTRHQPALPLYTEQDALRCLKAFKPVEFGRAFELVPGVRCWFSPQGHILGAAAVLMEAEGRRLVFSGDVGRPNDLVMRAPAPLPDCDWVLLESTYGNRRHPQSDLTDSLALALRRVLARGGVAVIPAFAVGRAQLLLHVIATLQHEGRIPHAPVYLNSPMATDVTALYERYRADHRLDDAALQRMRQTTRIVNSAEESKALNRRSGPMIIVAASGMLTGGRVLHHLAAFGPDHRNMILLPGFQAGGTRGAALVRGEDHLRIYGEEVPIRAEVVPLEAASAHADAEELLNWLCSAPHLPQRVFLTHGEPEAADALRVAIQRRLGVDAHVPEYLEQIELPMPAA